eukprot:100879-Rhodomonas_salina.1
MARRFESARSSTTPRLPLASSYLHRTRTHTQPCQRISTQTRTAKRTRLSASSRAGVRWRGRGKREVWSSGGGPAQLERLVLAALLPLALGILALRVAPTLRRAPVLEHLPE